MQEWSKRQIYEFLTRADDAVWEKIKEQAFAVRRRVFGNRVFLRGLIELTNYCKNDCYYCGIRRSSQEVSRYRLGREEVLACCEEGHRIGYRTFVPVSYTPLDVYKRQSMVLLTAIALVPPRFILKFYIKRQIRETP